MFNRLLPIFVLLTALLFIPQVEASSRIKLKTTITADRDPVVAGEVINYNVVVKNTSKKTAKKVRACLKTPANTKVVSISRSAQVNKDQVCISAGTLKKSKSTTYTLRLRIGTAVVDSVTSRFTTTGSNVKKSTSSIMIEVLPAEADSPTQPDGSTSDSGGSGSGGSDEDTDEEVEEDEGPASGVAGCEKEVEVNGETYCVIGSGA